MASMIDVRFYATSDPDLNRREMTMEVLLELASQFAQDRFDALGHLYPLWHAITSEGTHAVLQPKGATKDENVALVRAEFKQLDVIRYVYLDEAWMLEAPDFSREVIERGIRHHPDRVEVVMFSAEDRDRGQLAARRRIIRPPNKKPYLGPLELDPHSGFWAGRIVHLLTPPGRLN
jgi:hypothetical protein